jgi:hypothetical protein
LVEDLRRFEPPWIKVGRLCRHVCFLRSEGRLAEARRVEETDLADALAEVRQAHEPEPEVEARLALLRSEADRRVADAVAYAEVLVPMLAERLKALVPLAGSPTIAPPRKPRVEAPGDSRGIADFIDEMLVQDRAHSR